MRRPPLFCVFGNDFRSLVFFDLVKEALGGVAEVDEAGFTRFHHDGTAFHLAAKIAVAEPPQG